jgi:hypothetical protein
MFFCSQIETGRPNKMDSKYSGFIGIIFIAFGVVCVCIVPFIVGVMMLARGDSQGAVWAGVSGGFMALEFIMCVVYVVAAIWAGKLANYSQI